MDATLNSLTPHNLDAAYRFLQHMSRVTPGLCCRPKEAMTRAAQKPYGGVVAIRDDHMIGLTALYDTMKPDFVEIGSACVLPSERKNGLGQLLLATAISNFYADGMNHDRTIIADVFAINPHVLRMLLSLGFIEINAPQWYDEQRRSKGSPDEMKLPYHCITIDKNALPHIHALYPQLGPQQRQAA